MKPIVFALVALGAPLFLCGCFDVKDDLTINADGSGSVRLETKLLVPAEMVAAMGSMGGGNGPVMYPPITESEAKRFFPANDFTTKVKQEKVGEDTVTIIDATFKDINALLASPYGRAHALAIRLEGSTLRLKAIPGLEGPAHYAEMKDEGMFGPGAPVNLADLQKNKDKMKMQFRVTLPNEAAAATGTHDGKTVTWTFERARAKDAADFAQQLGTPLEASCPGAGVKFSPDSPPRLALQPFAELQEGSFGGKGSGPDTNKIRAAAKFVPYAVRVSRSVDLSGESGSRGSEAHLIGAVVLPRDLAPQKWGEVKLDEAVDAKGNNLKPDEESFGNRFSHMERYIEALDDEDENEEGEAKPKAPSTDERRTITLQFQSPEWQVKTIERVKGNIALHYYSGMRVVKLTNSIPAAWIREIKNQDDAMRFGDHDGSARMLSAPALPELGLALKFQMGMSMGAMTTLMIEAEGKQSSVTDAQVFDKDGRPWPTIMHTERFSGDGSMQIVIAGQPSPPLSLALMVTGGGTTVEVPILAEKIPCK